MLNPVLTAEKYPVDMLQYKRIEFIDDRIDADQRFAFELNVMLLQSPIQITAIRNIAGDKGRLRQHLIRSKARYNPFGQSFRRFRSHKHAIRKIVSRRSFGGPHLKLPVFNAAIAAQGHMASAFEQIQYFPFYTDHFSYFGLIDLRQNLL